MNSIRLTITKKHILLTCLLASALLLTACAGTATGGSDPAGSGSGFGSGSGGSSFRSGAARNLSAEAKLALGTIKLEGTPQAVNPQTAAKLLPLWELMAQLDSSNSSAPQEIAAVMDQIKATMTPQQVNTVDSMTFTSADIFSVFQQQAQSSGSGGSGGGGSGFGGFGGNRGNGSNRGGGGVFFGGGGPGGGGFGGGGFGGAGIRPTTGNGSSSSTTSQATADQQAQAAKARENAISTLLIDQLVRLLQTKVST